MRRRTSYLIIVLLMVIVGGGAFVLIEISSPHASDSDLIKKFNEREPDFNLLAQMADEDSKVSFINSSSVRLEIKDGLPTTIYLRENETLPRSEADLGFSQQRWDEYRRLFKKLNLHGMDRKHDMPDTIFFTASIDYPDWSEDGIEVTEKGYVYSVNGRDSLTASLHVVKVDRPAMFFKKLNDHNHWYLFNEWSFIKPE